LRDANSGEKTQPSIRNSGFCQVVTTFWTKRSRTEAWIVVGWCFDDYFLAAAKDVLLELHEKDTSSDSAKEHNQTACQEIQGYLTPASSSRGVNRHHGQEGQNKNPFVRLWGLLAFFTKITRKWRAATFIKLLRTSYFGYLL
jgi:hypothetical protein